MLEFNDANADVTRNGFSIFVDSVETDEDVYIGSTCIFMEDFHTSGNIKAQYSLTVYGTLSVDGKLSVGEDLSCGSLEIGEGSIERNLTVRDNASAKNLFVGGNAILGNVFAQDMLSYGNIFVRDGIDIQGNLEADNAVIGIDYISVSGTLKCAYAISGSISADTDQVGNAACVPQKKHSSTTETIEDKPEQIHMADSSVEDIFDGDSVLAIGMEDCALFLEKLNEHLCEIEPWDKDILNYLDAYGGFVPVYHMIYNLLGSSMDALTRHEIVDSLVFPDLLICGESLIHLPEWLHKSIIAKRYIEKCEALLSFALESKLKTRSRSEWMQCLGLIGQINKLYPEETDLGNLLGDFSVELFRNAGLKSLSVKLYLPEE